MGARLPGAPTLRYLLLGAIRRAPGRTSTQLYHRVQRRECQVMKELKALETEGLVERRTVVDSHDENVGKRGYYLT